MVASGDDAARRTEETRRTAGILAVSTTTVIWGLAPLVLKQIDMPMLTFAAYRLWMGVLVSPSVFAVTGRRLRGRRSGRARSAG